MKLFIIVTQPVNQHQEGIALTPVDTDVDDLVAVLEDIRAKYGTRAHLGIQYECHGKPWINQAALP